MVMVFNSWLSVLLVEKTGESGENHDLSQVHLHMGAIRTHNCSDRQIIVP
jgi:hypothetical protein